MTFRLLENVLLFIDNTQGKIMEHRHMTNTAKC